MAKKIETTYVNASADNFSDEINRMFAREREIYNQLKSYKGEIVDALRIELDIPEGMELSTYSYTRWGQLQLHFTPEQAPKPAVVQRQSLADYLASRR